MSRRSPEGRRRARASAAFLRSGVAALIALWSAPGKAEERDLRSDLVVDGALTAGFGLYWLGTEPARPILAPEACRVCAPPGAFDASIRHTLRWEDTESAHRLSNATAFALSPLVSLSILSGGAETDEARAENFLFVLESVVIAGALNQTTKLLFARPRPFVAASPERARRSPERSDHFLSFYSGHTSFSASVGASAAMIATLRGYDVAPHLWGAFVGTTLVTGYLRIAADRHYASDVLVGALVGAAVGIAVPALLHPRQGAEDGEAPISGASDGPLFYVGGRF